MDYECYEDAVTPYELVLMSVRSCAHSQRCFGLYHLLTDWFGRDSAFFMHNIQTLYWARAVCV